MRDSDAAARGLRPEPIAGSRYITPSDVRIVEVGHQFEDFQYRAPYQFGGRSVDRVTILNVNCRLRAGDGREAWGFGSMTLGNAWAFPAASQDVGLGAMKALADELNPITADCDENGHPDRSVSGARAAVLRAAAAVSQAQALPVADPQALHAGGRQRVRRRHPRRLRQGVRRELLRDVRPAVHDAATCRTISAPAFKGEYPRSLRPRRRHGRARLSSIRSAPAIHSRRPTFATRIDDGLPNTLEEWIPRDGLIRFKIKLNGGDLAATSSASSASTASSTASRPRAA